MEHETFQIPVEGAAVESVSAILQRGDGAGEPTAVLLAHGAGAPMDCEFMEDLARGLVLQGFDVLRFSYPYMERAKREGRRFPPDRQPKLESAHRAALELIRAKLPSKEIVLAGKSMGAAAGSIGGRGGVHNRAFPVPWTSLYRLSTSSCLNVSAACPGHLTTRLSMLVVSPRPKWTHLLD